MSLASSHLFGRDLVNPYADVELPSILYDQPYDVSLHLVLPATESNYALGNFMASLRLSNSYNRTLAIVRRPVGGSNQEPLSQCSNANVSLRQFLFQTTNPFCDNS